MSAIQLGKMSNGGGIPFRTPLILALMVLCLIWSILVLDLPIASTVKSSISVIAQEHGTEAHDVSVEGSKINLGSDSTAITEASDSKPHTATSSVTVQESGSATKDLPLILYAYADSVNDTALHNLKFFLAHGLHAAADFIFILNGETETDVAGLIPKKDNIQVIHRPNDCYDMGAYAEVLLKDDLYKSYKRFITMNASIRGPFLPYWSEGCWTDMFLSKITDEVKLVGVTANCWPNFHIQSMIWATDLIGIETLLFPPQKALDYLNTHPIKLPNPSEGAKPITISKPTYETSSVVYQAPGINGCFHTWYSAVAAEISSTALIRAAGYKVDAMMSAYHGNPEYEEGKTCEENVDVFFDEEYFGINVHPFETVFIKANRDVAPLVLERHTDWANSWGYSSYDHCRA